MCIIIIHKIIRIIMACFFMNMIKLWTFELALKIQYYITHVNDKLSQYLVEIGWDTSFEEWKW